jgi:hypothetical protein
MFKHKINKNVIFEGKTYIPCNGIVELPKRDERYNPIEEEKNEHKELVEKAVELGLGNFSTLDRLTDKTLKKKIEEAE